MPRDILLLRAVLSVCLLLWAAAASTSDRVVLAPSKVTSVKIHGNKAEVSREFELAEYEDDSYILVRVDGLTNQLEDKSVRVKGVGRAEIIESSVSSRAVPRDLDPVYGAQLSFLQRLAAHAAAAVETSKAALQRAAAQKEYVQSYTKASIASKPSLPTGDSTAPSPMLSIQAMTEILAFQDSVAAEMDVKAATAARDVAVGSARLRAIQSSVDALRSRGVYTPYTEEGLLYCPSDMDCSAPSLATATTWPLSAAAKAVEVRVRTGSAAPGRPKPALKFSLSYMAGPARWYPEYDIRLEGDSAQSSRQYSIEVDYYAAVEQQTMESWDGVNMALSTTSPVEAERHPQPVQRGVFYVEHSPLAEPMMMMDAAPMMKRGKAMKARGRSNHMAAGMAEENEMWDAPQADFAEAMAAPPDMAVRGAHVEQAGDLGASYQFQLPHPVNISSTERVRGGGADGVQSAGPRKLLVDTLKLSSTVFSFAVPSLDSRAFLRAWGELPADASVPIIQSDVYRFHPLSGAGGSGGGARIFIQGTFSGETSVAAVQPGGTMHLSLGQDRNVEVKNTPILAKHSNKEEDKSTWLTTDKTKFRVKTESFSLYAKSTHSGPMLVILAESIPVSSEEEVRVEILSPDPKSIVGVDDTHSGGGDAAMDAILAVAGRQPPSDMERGNKLHVLMSKETGHIYWARWLNPSQTIVSTLQYKLTWPDKKEIVVA